MLLLHLAKPLRPLHLFPMAIHRCLFYQPLQTLTEHNRSEKPPTLRLPHQLSDIVLTVALNMSCRMQHLGQAYETWYVVLSIVNPLDRISDNNNT